MKKIAIAAALALGMGAVAVGTSSDADARVSVVVTPYNYGYVWGYTKNRFRPLNAKKYIACRGQVTRARLFSPAFVFAIDNCYLGEPW